VRTTVVVGRYGRWWLKHAVMSSTEAEVGKPHQLIHALRVCRGKIWRLSCLIGPGSGDRIHSFIIEPGPKAYCISSWSIPVWPSMSCEQASLKLNIIAKFQITQLPQQQPTHHYCTETADSQCCQIPASLPCHSRQKLRPLHFFLSIIPAVACFLAGAGV
jgi:hypothetical protein